MPPTSVAPSPPCHMVVVGDEGCGKTALIHRLIGRPFDSMHVPTLEAQYPHPWHPATAILDTAGARDADRLRPISYRNAGLILLCYRPNIPFAFLGLLDRWGPELNHYVPTVPRLLVGCAVDAADRPQAAAAVAGEAAAAASVRPSEAAAGSTAALSPSPSPTLSVPGTYSLASSCAHPGDAWMDPVALAAKLRCEGYIATSARTGAGVVAAFGGPEDAPTLLWQTVAAAAAGPGVGMPHAMQRLEQRFIAEIVSDHDETSLGLLETDGEDDGSLSRSGSMTDVAIMRADAARDLSRPRASLPMPAPLPVARPPPSPPASVARQPAAVMTPPDSRDGRRVDGGRPESKAMSPSQRPGPQRADRAAALPIAEAAAQGLIALTPPSNRAAAAMRSLAAADRDRPATGRAMTDAGAGARPEAVLAPMHDYIGIAMAAVQPLDADAWGVANPRLAGMPAASTPALAATASPPVSTRPAPGPGPMLLAPSSDAEAAAPARMPRHGAAPGHDAPALRSLRSSLPVGHDPIRPPPATAAGDHAEMAPPPPPPTTPGKAAHAVHRLASLARGGWSRHAGRSAASAQSRRLSPPPLAAVAGQTMDVAAGTPADPALLPPPVAPRGSARDRRAAVSEQAQPPSRPPAAVPPAPPAVAAPPLRKRFWQRLHLGLHRG